MFQCLCLKLYLNHTIITEFTYLNNRIFPEYAKCTIVHLPSLTQSDSILLEYVN